MLGLTERSLAVDRVAERIDDAAEQAVTDGDLEDLARGLDRLALLDVADVPKDHGADRVLVEVQRQPLRSVFELEQLVHGAAREAADAGDAVTHLSDGADLLLEECRLEAVETMAQRGRDVFDVDRELGHVRLLP